MLAAPVPVVLDADALTLLVTARSADRLRQRHGAHLVTPHDREFARLGRRAGRAPTGSAAALRLAAWLNARGPAQGGPHGRRHAGRPGVRRTRPAPPALATAGTGDVLAGLLGSLLAAGLAPDRAAVDGGVPARAGRPARRPGGGPVTAPGRGRRTPALTRSWLTRSGRAAVEPARSRPSARSQVE